MSPVYQTISKFILTLLVGIAAISAFISFFINKNSCQPMHTTVSYHAQIAEVCNEVAAFGLGGDWRCRTDTHQSYALMTGLAGILHALRTLIGPRPTLEPLLPITRRSMAS